MIFLIYKILWWVILPWVLFFRYLKDKKSGKGFRYLFERLGFSAVTKPHDIVMHAVSLGEVRAMTPLVIEVLKQFPDHKVLITTTTLTGRAQLESYFGDRVSITFLPHDIGFFIRRFLKKIQPKAFLIMETEIWPNLFDSCQQLDIPTFIISACLSERSQKGYSKIPKTIHQLLSNVHIMAQTKEDQERFISVGATQVSVMGNLKYITVLPDDFAMKSNELIRAKKDQLLWCLASSHAGEEKIVINQFIELKKEYPYLKLAIAPRHPERFSEVENLIIEHNLKYQKRSETQFTEFSFDDADVWLFDSIGELLYLYGASDIVTVAGSFVSIGGHNILEPAFLKKAITVGPYIDNIQDMIEQFQQNDAIMVLNADDLYVSIKKLIDGDIDRTVMGERAYKVVMQNQKALSIVVEELHNCIKEV